MKDWSSGEMGVKVKKNKKIKKMIYKVGFCREPMKKKKNKWGF